MDRPYGNLEVTDNDRAAASRYAAVIEWSENDGVYVVTVPDIPNLHTHGGRGHGTLDRRRAKPKFRAPPHFSALPPAESGKAQATYRDALRR